MTSILIEQPRQVLLALDLTEDSWRAMQWFLENIYKAGDTIHLVHVAKLKDETSEIATGHLGVSYHYQESTLQQTEAALNAVRLKISEKFDQALASAGITHQTHLFLEGENAPATAVAAIIDKVFNEIHGSLIVASRSNKTRAEQWWLGSVAESLSRLPHPLVLVTAPSKLSPAEEAASKVQ